MADTSTGTPGEALEDTIDVFAARIAGRLDRLVEVLNLIPGLNPPTSTRPRPVRVPEVPIVDMTPTRSYASDAFDDWRTDAACRFTFNPGMKGNEPNWQHNNDVAQVLRFCQLCPVVAECGEYAQAMGISEGVWGGVRLHKARDRVSR